MTKANYLPECPQVSLGVRLGRNPKEGYQRGWGLKYTADCDLHQQILADKDFWDAYSLIHERKGAGSSVCGPERLMNIFLLIKFFLPKLPPGDIAEFGCYKGGSAIFMAKLAQKFLPGVRVYGFDTFAGMPDCDPTVDAHVAGQFNDTDLSEINKRKIELGLFNLTFVKGLFQDTAASELSRRSVALAHIDADQYDGCLAAYEAVKPRMVPGGYIVFDDATEPSCIGATEVCEMILSRRDGLASEQIWPHFVFRAPGV